MIPPAAPHPAGAVLRLVRTAAGRRVLQLALLVGGLAVLGLLGGGRAQAADGGGSTPATAAGVTSTVERTVARAAALTDAHTAVAGGDGPGGAPGARHASEVPRDPDASSAPREPRRPSDPRRPDGLRGPGPGRAGNTAHAGHTAHAVRTAHAAEVVPPAHPAPAPRAVWSVRGDGGGGGDMDGAVRRVIRTVADGPVRPVAEQAVGRVGGVVEAAAGAPGGTAGQWPPASALPLSLPRVTLPPLSLVPPGPSSPADPRPVPDPHVLPGRSGAPPGAVQKQSPSSAPGGRALAHTAKEPWPRWAGGPADPAATGGEDRTTTSGDLAGQRRTVPLPLPRPPGGDPSGLLGERSLVDNGGPRHADPHAVAVRQRALPRLAPGALAKHPAEDVRYRSGEVPSPPGRDLREAARQRPRPPVPGPVRVRPPCGAVRGSAPSSS
ncbi:MULTISPECIES: hypothetical protein [Streptomyces]|uniref:hypothetical protein n=1 Tax=Streptomyces TaxID=1883 RepID=UPI0029B36807|nr:hypothetical protein [Streptomyces sp. ME02-6978.2a]MDX3363333.1 hypothetical protein [Streptomyces sp. ME02-6978.2a]